MRNPAIGLLRSDMADLQDAWEAGQTAKAEGWLLDPLHDAIVYAALPLLGMHGLTQLARHIERQEQTLDVEAATAVAQSWTES